MRVIKLKIMLSRDNNAVLNNGTHYIHSDIYICVCVCVYVYIYIYIYTHLFNHFIYDMIYLLTAVGLKPVAVVQYTFTHKQYLEQHN